MADGPLIIQACMNYKPNSNAPNKSADKFEEFQKYFVKKMAEFWKSADPEKINDLGMLYKDCQP